MKKNKPTRRVRKAYANAMVKHSSTPRGIAKIHAMRSHSDSATMVAMTNHYCWTATWLTNLHTTQPNDQT